MYDDILLDQEKSVSILEQVKFDQPFKNNLVFKYPSENLKLGSQLIVGQGQEAIFVKGGEICDVFLPGTHTIKSANLPLLNRIVNFAFGGDTPFTAEIWFIDTTIKRGIKWGTKQPIQVVDPKFNYPVSVRSFGEWGFRIADTTSFLKQIVGNKSLANTNLVDEYFSSEILQKLSGAIASYIEDNNCAIFSVTSKINQISSITKDEITADFDRFGIEIINFNIQSISIPKEEQSKIQETMAKRMEAEQLSSVNLSQSYVTMKTLETLDKAAAANGNLGQILGAGLGLGVGFGGGVPLGQQMANNMSLNAAPPADDTMGKLKKLKELFDNGLIDESEYASKKKAILDTL